MKTFKELITEDKRGVEFLQLKDHATKLEDELAGELCSVEIHDHKKEHMVRVEIKTCGDAKEIKKIENAIAKKSKKSLIDAHLSIMSAGKLKVLLTYKQ